MAKSAEHARANMVEAIKKLGGLTLAAGLTGVSEQTVRTWMARGNLNKADALNAVRFARAVRRPLDDFLDESPS